MRERRKVISVSLGGKDFQFLESGFFLYATLSIFRFLVEETLKIHQTHFILTLKYVKCIGSQFLLCRSVSESVVGERNYWDHDLLQI